MEWLSNTLPVAEGTQSRGVQAGEPAPTPPGGNAAPVRMIVFDFSTKQTESWVVLLFVVHDHPLFCCIVLLIDCPVDLLI